MAKKRVRAAFVGSGGMAVRHSDALSKMQDVQVVGFCDVVPAIAAERVKTYGGEAFEDAADMMDKLAPDAVFFCLPPFAHGAELEAVKRGIPFFVEKPVGLDLALTRKIAAAVRKAKVLTCAGYMNRYRQGVQTLKKMLKKDPPILMLGGWIGGTPKPGPSQIWKWWIVKSKSGGQFLEQVTHTIDLARFLCGEADTVSAAAAQGFNKGAPPQYSNDDAMTVNIKFKSGAIANLWASCSANGGGGGVSLNVFANKITGKFAGWDHTVTILQQGKDPVEIKGEPEIFALEDAVFINAVRTGRASKVMSSYEDGARTLAISIAANQSAATGKPVRVPVI